MADTPLRHHGPKLVADLEDKYRAEAGEVFMTGIQGLVRVLLDQMRVDRLAGRNSAAFVSGYPGSPLGGLDQELLARRTLLEEFGVVHRPGLNEELAATAVMGSQGLANFGAMAHDGVVGMWYGKAPGVDRAADALRTGNYAGATRAGGAVVIAGDDPACKSSTLPSNSAQLLADLKLPVLFPGNVQDLVELGLHGVALSRLSALWTALKVNTSVADGSGTVTANPSRVVPVEPDCTVDGRPFARQTVAPLSPRTIIQIEEEINEVRLEIAARYGEANRLNATTHDAPAPWMGIVASGTTYFDVIEALAQLGLSEHQLADLGIRIMKVGMLFPFPHMPVRRFADGLHEILVVEEKQPLVERAVRDALYGTTGAPLVVGKRDERGRQLVRSFGVLDATIIARVLRGRLAQRIAPEILAPEAPERPRIDLAMVPRTPYFCSGCPHNSSLKAPPGAKIGAGIGCHSMVTFLDPERAGSITGVTQMGGEGTQWIGAAPFVDTPHLFQNIGDGTFFHSGSLAVRAAVAAGVNITFKLLVNDAVAMTGGQDVVGGRGVPAIVQLLMAEGVRHIIVTTEDRTRYRHVRLAGGTEVWDRSRIVEAQEALSRVPGTTVLIHDQQCAAEARRMRKRGLQPEPSTRVVIAERVCEGCGDCGVVANCLSLQPVDTEFGRKTRVDLASCNKDYLCLEGDCPSFLTVRSRRGLTRWARRRGRGEIAPSSASLASALDDLGAKLPDPTSKVPNAECVVRMPGVGGTGVVTVAQILGTAASMDGLHVMGVDQTGLSQKGGAVVSDIRIARAPIGGSNRLAAGSVDLYLVFDVVAGLAASNLESVDPERTVAVVSTTPSATGLMIGRPDIRQPELSEMQAALEAVTRAGDNCYVDAGRLASGLFGRPTAANLLLLGVAYQAGAVPVSAASIERAIERIGVAVETNVRAFRAGRQWVADPSPIDALLRRGDPIGMDDGSLARMLGDLDADELGRILRVRVPDLVDYQDMRYGERYLSLVRQVHAAEQQVVPGSTELSQAVARGYHKLLAYKDEYEVARLHLLERRERAAFAAAGGEDVVVSWNLHPPVLRALGMRRKIRLGPWFTTVYKVLVACRRLRGTPFDPFGRAHVRKVERRLACDYAEMVRRALPLLGTSSLPDVVALASLPEMVRGYEEIKLRSVQGYEAAAADLLERLSSASS